MAKKLSKIITQEEFERLLKATFTAKLDKRFQKNKKKYALAMLLGFEAGMRISEIVGYKDRVPALLPENVDINRNSIFVKSGKGKKDRIVPLPKRIRAKALDLLPLQINRRSLELWVKKISKEVLNKDITFHTLRAGFITHLLNKGVPVHQVQMLVGHEKMSTTGVYARADPQLAIKNAIDVF